MFKEDDIVELRIEKQLAEMKKMILELHNVKNDKKFKQ
jgi:hypothetical protein